MVDFYTLFVFGDVVNQVLDLRTNTWSRLPDAPQTHGQGLGCGLVTDGVTNKVVLVGGVLGPSAVDFLDVGMRQWSSGTLKQYFDDYKDFLK